MARNDLIQYHSDAHQYCYWRESKVSYFGEEVIYSQESPKIEESFKDFNWDLNRFVEYGSPFTRKETLPIIKKPI